MIETICRDCGTRYPLGQDHTCPKRPAKKPALAVKLADRPPDAARKREADGIAGRSAKKSTAARKDVLATPKIAPSDSEIGEDANEAKLPAGTQALPVDVLAKAEAASAHLAPKRGRGRPRGLVPFDKKAHDRQKSAERRAKLKAEGKSK